MQLIHRRLAWRRSTALITLAALAGAGWSPAGAAETATTDDAAGASPPAAGGAVQEVVVTARRREESVSKVPVAVTALGAADLAQRAITTDADLQRSVPGLTIRETFNPNFQNYSIRGQTIDAFSSSRPAVVAYFNDVQTPQGSSSAFYDLSSIQVLKGPQGTLFGRNATGGAVLYSTALPRNTFDGYLTASAGNYGMGGAQGAMDLPLISDTLLVRLAGLISSRDGYVDNLFTGEKLGSARQQSGRITILARPTSRLQLITTYQYSGTRAADVGTEIYTLNPCGVNYNGAYKLNTTVGCFYSPELDKVIGVPGLWNAFLAAHPGVPAGGVPAELALQRAWGPWTTSLDEPEGTRVLGNQITQSLKYEISPDMTFKAIVGYGRQNTHLHGDLDGTPFPIEHNYNYQTGQTGPAFNASDYSEEAQILGTALGGRFKYIGGAYFSQELVRNLINLEVFNITPIVQPTPDSYVYGVHTESQAMFFQGTYDIGDLIHVQNVRFTAGARYTWEQNRIDQYYGSVLYGAPSERETAKDPSWQFGLEYQIFPELLLYVNQRGSWRGGGFNASAPPVDTTAASGGNLFLPETTTDLEAGAKYSGLLWSRPARLNVDVYDQVVDNVQRAAQLASASGNIIAATANVPQAEVTGVEVDGDFAPIAWLRVGGSFAWTDARYTKGNLVLLGNPLTYNSYADTPEFTGDVFVQIGLPVPQAWGALSARGDVYAQSVQYFSNEAFSTQPGTAITGYHLVNLHLDWNGVFGSRYSVSAFANNVANQPYWTGGNAQQDSAGFSVATPGLPRMFGASVTARF